MRAVVVGCLVVVVEAVAIERGCEGDEEVVVCVECEVWDEVTVAAEVAFPVWKAERARKAARKFERKGRCVDIFV